MKNFVISFVLIENLLKSVAKKNNPHKPAHRRKLPKDAACPTAHE